MSIKTMFSVSKRNFNKDASTLFRYKLSEVEKESRIAYKKNLFNPRFIKTCSAFSLVYFFTIYGSYHSQNKITRIAAAGSLTFLCCELTFFPLDAINLN